MRPYALARVVAILVFLAWVLSSVIPFTEPPKHVRPTDATALPPSEIHPPAGKGTRRPTQLLTEAAVADILRQNGYQAIGTLKQQPDGAWLATAARAGDRKRLKLRIGEDGQVTQQ
jgi:hypothetical protein